MIATDEKDINGLRAAGKVCAQAMHLMMESAKPGMTTLELDQIGEEFLKKNGAKSAPRVMYNPAAPASASYLSLHMAFPMSMCSKMATSSTSMSLLS
jgi:methionine aminopeptidase